MHMACDTHDRWLTGVSSITSEPNFNCNQVQESWPNKNMAPRSSKLRDESLGSSTVQKPVECQKS